MSTADPRISAPVDIRYCARCATEMSTRMIGGKQRRACPACSYVHFVEPKVGVGVVLIEAERLLLVRRAMPPEVGKWSIPAGFLDSGEDPRATAMRETREETGLEVRITDLVEVFHNPARPGAKVQGASVFILFRGSRTGGTLRPGDDADAADFFGPGELPPLAFASTLAAVEELERLGCPKRDEER